MSACQHTNRSRVVQGAPAVWCNHCGAVHDGERWHRPKAPLAPKPKRAAKKRAAKKAAAPRGKSKK